MNWKFWQAEKRESGGSFSDSVIRLIEAQAAGSAADAGSTAAVEAASGALSRAFSAAKVLAPIWAVNGVSPAFLAQVGRDLIRRGESMHRIDIDRMGMLRLIPVSSWHFQGSANPDTWTVRASEYGPSTSTTRNLPYTAFVFVKWGATPGQPYTGVGPLSWAHTTARLQSETERSLADESAGPITNLLPIPQDGGDDDDDADPLKLLKADIAAARGKALLLETTAAGYGEGMASAPRRDWVASRLGPTPPEAMVRLRSDAFQAVLAATGTPPALFTDSDGTSQREAVRRWHANVVLPMAGMLQTELREKLEAPDLTLTFDNYPLDLQGRASSFQKLVAGGVGVNEALATSGLLADEMQS